MLKAILAKSKYLILVAVLFSLIASLSAFIWGSVKTVTALLHLASSHGEDPLGAFEVISIIDTFLRAAFYIISVGLYELIMEDVVMPARIIVHNLHDLKATLVSMIVLAVTFLEHLWRGNIRTARCTSESLSRLFPHHSLRSVISAIKIMLCDLFIYGEACAFSPGKYRICAS
jgi:uncharacterized membrane protein YqhA